MGMGVIMSVDRGLGMSVDRRVRCRWIGEGACNSAISRRETQIEMNMD